MAAQVSYPGVYIEEFTPGAPIEGVGTGNAAFVGIAPKGDLRRPTKLTTWDQFRDRFGEQPVPGFYLWYAVRGFFENGGQVCYVVRASNGKHAGLGLPDQQPATGPGLVDRAGTPMLRVRAVHPGVPSPAITIQVTETNVLNAPTGLYQPQASYTAVGPPAATVTREIEAGSAADAAQFRPGDVVDLGAPGPRRLVSVAGNRLRLSADIPLPGAGTMRLADTLPGARTVRIEAPPANAPVVGTILTISQAANTDTQVVETVQAEPLATTPATTTYRVTFREPLKIALGFDGANPGSVTSQELSIETGQTPVVKPYPALGADPSHARYFLRVVNEEDPLVRLELIEPPPAGPLPDRLLAGTGGAVPLLAGQAETLATIGSADFQDALDTLRGVDDVNLVAVPDCVRLKPPHGTPDAVQQAVITHCEQTADRFAVLDAQPGLPLFGDGSIETQRAGLDSPGGYAGLYYPWLRVRPAAPGALILVPPSGHVCGIIARTDATRGVHKAPANEIVNGALGVETTMSDVEQGQLNLVGINVIRVFQTGGRPVLWGARTTATKVNNSWMYVNIRRLFLFCEESIVEGTRWAVFEPNNPGLWQKLKRSLTEFLTRVWRDGALFGVKPEEAFYVRIDEALNPDSERALGRLYIEIGLRPSYPAEFIIVRIGIWQGGSEVTEL